jgi:hypothetical protein
MSGDDDLGAILRHILHGPHIGPSPVRRPQPAPPAQPAPAPTEPQRKPWSAKEAFSVVKAKKRQRAANASRNGVRSRPMRRPDSEEADVMVRDAIREIRARRSQKPR